LAGIFPKIGKRKIKSILAVLTSFLMWQLVRLWMPTLEVHPLFAYIYSMIEIRKTHEETSRLGKARIKTTIIGCSVAFLILFIRSLFQFGNETVNVMIEIAFILIGVLLALSIAQALKCDPLCSIAASTFIICSVSHEGDVYVYAAFRAIQTVMGVIIAYVINKYMLKEKENMQNKEENDGDAVL